MIIEILTIILNILIFYLTIKYVVIPLIIFYLFKKAIKQLIKNE